jgi:hypothetical protein
MPIPSTMVFDICDTSTPIPIVQRLFDDIGSNILEFLVNKINGLPLQYFAQISALKTEEDLFR